MSRFDAIFIGGCFIIAALLGLQSPASLRIGIGAMWALAIVAFIAIFNTKFMDWLVKPL